MSHCVQFQVNVHVTFIVFFFFWIAVSLVSRVKRDIYKLVNVVIALFWCEIPKAPITTCLKIFL